jgi:serine/threonine protein kinase
MARKIVLDTAFDRYMRGKSIGQGGSGIVYRATSGGGEEVAVKVLELSRATATRRKRFQNEIKFCQTTDHANIVRVTDYGVTAEGAPFFVMPLFPETLRTWMRQEHHSEGRLRMFTLILDGVEAAHMRSVTHRDLKPENILVDGDSVPAVADFGIAAFEEEDLYTAVETRDNDRLANFIYAAPEQKNRGKSVDRRADIYALGLILNEMFTGDTPQGSNPRRIANVDSDVSYLDDVVDRMIRQSSAERPDSISVVKDLLLARRNEFIAHQKLDALQRQVVKITDVTDPIVVDPIRIVHTDYQNGALVFTFNHSLPAKYLNLLRQVGGSYYFGSEPERLQFAGNTARLPASRSAATSVKGQVEEWIRRTNAEYPRHLREEAEVEARLRRERLEKERQEEEEHLKLLRALNP